MRVVRPSGLPILGITPFHRPDARLAVALVRAGAIGVVDLGVDRSRGLAALRLAAGRVDGGAGGELGVRVHEGALPRPAELPDEVRLVVLPPGMDATVWQRPGRRTVLVRVVSREQALAAAEAGADGLIAVGLEAGGPVGEESTFVLLQRLIEAVPLPVWAQGGIGLHTAAACLAGGAAGIVLDAQLALVRESGLGEGLRQIVAGMDGSETTLIAGRRVLTRPDLPFVARMREAGAADVDAALGGDDPARQLVPAGQDAAFARGLAQRFVTAGGVVQAVRRAAVEHLAIARERAPLAAGAPLALDHRTRFPIVQGPMTRVSDTAAFADAVSRAGALPFLALALMDGKRVAELIAETAQRLGDRPWGVGILGFVPSELRSEQLAELERTPPPFAIIAGGRPAQSRGLERLGTTTYLHVPSPGLLELFLKQGARRFVFEGFECGGHVGPRSSFALWESQIEILLGFERPEEVAVLFAGGVHDARSAAMVAALSATLDARGVKVGVLMGTAYLFTEEAVATGAIQPGYQEMALGCCGTALLETAPGHSTRCVRNDYVDTFVAEREALARQGLEGREAWARLERLNLGRLRIASKGLRRDGERFVEVPDPVQRREGMYMIGQVAALRDRVTTMEELHRSVSAGATERIAALPAPPVEEPARRVDVAVIGMACLFPGAPDLESYWSNVVGGVDAVTEVPSERWNKDIYYDPGGRPGMSTPSKWGGFLQKVAFDPAEYGIPPNSLAAIEPVQLLSLHIARQALADAGYARREFDRGRTAVIFGAEGGTELAAGYGFRSLFPQYVGQLPQALEDVLPRPTEDSFPGLLANVIAGRISNRLDLGGKNFTVDAACASSLAAVDVAVEALGAGSCDMVIAGGADTHNSIGDYLLFSSVHALSAQGRCRAFDRSADGITLGEGVAALVLKRLVDAERDGDRVYAVIKGVGASSDGKSLGLTAPRLDGQVRALERAYREADLSPRDVGLMEAHGTGTVVGDRTELESMETVFLRGGAAPGSCVLGSVKSQIGHTKCAAGMASLIKGILAVYHGVLPPTLHLDQPNPGYDSAKSPFFFRDRAAPWLSERRVAGVSAFGFGGTNFHVVVARRPELPGERASGWPVWPVELFLFRGENRARAQQRIAALDRLSREESGWSLRDLARSTSCGGSGPVQVAFLARDRSELAARLESARRFDEDGKSVFVRPADTSQGKLAFLFPGQGSQRPNMLAELFVAFPELDELLAEGGEWAPLIWPARAFGKDERQAQEARLTDTRVAQPALGLAGLALARLLARLGLAPDMLAGHSYGELVGLCCAGGITPGTLFELSAARAEAILSAAGDDPGTMAAVSAGAEPIEAIVAGIDGLVLANHNAPLQTVISGPTPAVDRALERLKAEGVAARKLPVACAFHSGVVAGAQSAFATVLAGAPLAPLDTTLYSNRTAAPYPGDPQSSRRLLAEQLAQPVLFRRQIERMYEDGARVFVEVGPGRVLSGLVEKILAGRPALVVHTDAAGEQGLEQLQRALARLAVGGVEFDADPLWASRGAARFDIEQPPARALPPLAWWVNGHRAWPARGELPASAMKPVTSPPATLRFAGAADGGGADAAGAAGAGSREAAVLLYLRNLREIAEAQRQVMLGLLGSVPESAPPLAAVELLPAANAVPASAGVPRVHSAEVVPVPAPARAPAAAAPEIGSALLAIVSQRTGYPVEMLDLDLDLEADLSIDSIKRIEILGALNESLGMVDAAEAVREELVEELARIKSLRGIIEWLEQHVTAAAAANAAAPRAAGASLPAAAEAVPPPAADASIRRYLLEVREIPAASTNGRTLAGQSFAITEDGLGIREALARLIEGAGAQVSLIGERGRLDKVDGLIDLQALVPDSGPPELKRLFRFTKQAVRSGASVILAATGMGGNFGREANGLIRPGQGGTAGLLKSLSKERPSVHVRAIDLDPREAPAQLAAHIFDELMAGDERVEVGYHGGRRRALEVVPAGNGQSDATHGPDLGPGSVVLITGGARGITAEIAGRLAMRFGCALELVGRTPLSTEATVDPEIAAAQDGVALRRLLAARGVAEKPSEIERIAGRMLAEREIRDTLARLARAGSAVRYHAVDVRNARAFGRVIDDVYERHGRLDGVIHGAGVIEDKLLVDKTTESFDRVFDTKVKGALTLARKLQSGVSFVVFCSSVSSAFGNRGQTDYAAANDILDKLAHQLNQRLEGRVVSVNWGPWDSRGMVSPQLRREYDRRGIGLIPLAAGPDCLLSELGAGNRRHAQVILMSADPAALR